MHGRMERWTIGVKLTEIPFPAFSGLFCLDVLWEVGLSPRILLFIHLLYFTMIISFTCAFTNSLALYSIPIRVAHLNKFACDSGH